MTTVLVDKASAVRAAIPAGGLFAEKEWLISPEPLLVPDSFADELEKLGYRLHLFLKACNQLYFQSVKGKQPRWISELLDAGKPPELVKLSRGFREELPQVIRPDIVLTDDGYTIAELDSVPGGIGLTAWLSQTYSTLGYDVLGGADGMLEGFQSITPEGADIVVSEESATYSPEMHWLADELNARFAPLHWRVLDVNKETASIEHRSAVYRFFEQFDLPNIPVASQLTAAAARGELRVTPPFKPFLEEKLWFALFWLRPLRDFWRRELSERHFLQLQKVIPYTWLVDPTPVPPTAVLPGLEVNDWKEVGEFSQKQRELILKISGFSELAWGSRGVHMAADLPQREWQNELQHALDQYPKHPYILQRFHKGRLIPQQYVDPTSGEVRTMQGRVRLCPYYFLADGKAGLGGAMATICPADKKLLHGMKDAILVPASVKM